jgi:RimJ/RimL family protein N-acetyltransferase
MERALEDTVGDVRLAGPRVTVRTLRSADLDAMDAWRPFEDALHSLWGVPHSTPLSRSIWFAVYGSDPSRLWYVVERNTDGQVMGALSLREIVHNASARLGVSFGADYVDLGYGSEALRVFFPYYFTTLEFPRIVLDVAAANLRAVHVYERLGFRYTGSHYREVPDDMDLSFLEQEQFKPLRIHFRDRFGQKQLLFYDMALDRTAWEGLSSRAAIAQSLSVQ